MTDYGPVTEAKISEVEAACDAYGPKAIIALAGVPGTGKTFVASIAAQRVTTEPLLVREIQFHQSYSYEEFIEGLRIDDAGAVAVVPGVFLEWNQRAAEDPDHTYVLLIEELTRANLSAVLGELMTYLEYRDRPFTTIYSRMPVTVADNLVVLATYNPTDRSAIEIDAALLRRLRVLSFPPSIEQLEEMLTANEAPAPVIDKLKQLFAKCEEEFGDDYELGMPFGHGIFADVRGEDDLYPLWEQRIRHILQRPLLEPLPFTATIRAAYPWRTPQFRLPSAPAGPPSAIAETGHAEAAPYASDQTQPATGGSGPLPESAMEQTGEQGPEPADLAPSAADANPQGVHRAAETGEPDKA